MNRIATLLLIVSLSVWGGVITSPTDHVVTPTDITAPVAAYSDASEPHESDIQHGSDHQHCAPACTAVAHIGLPEQDRHGSLPAGITPTAIDLPPDRIHSPSPPPPKS